MPSSDSRPLIAVLGAAGRVGRQICGELIRRGARVAIAGRRVDPLVELAHQLPIAAVHPADAGDGEAMRRAFAGARCVVNAAGPLRETAEQVVHAALAAGAHYVDVGGEQAVLRALYERCESAVRRAGLIALPGAGLDCMIGDLAAAWATGALIGVSDAGDCVRTEPAPWLAEQHPLDDVAVTYALDDLALSPSSQRALFGALGTRALIWQRDRWEPGRQGRRIDAGPELGVREAVGYAGGDAITIPRHIGARRVAAYVSLTKGPAATVALRLALGALRLIPDRAKQVLVPATPAEAAYAQTQLAVIVEVRRGAQMARVIARGSDVYRTTAAITAWAAWRLAEREGPVRPERDDAPFGMRAPSELFRGELALREIASAAGLTIEPSFA